MSDRPVTEPRLGDPKHPLSQRVDEVCDRFEAAWMGGSPSIEAFLAGVDATERGAFLGELLKIDVAYRRGRGTAPSAREYMERFRGFESLIASIVGRDNGDSPRESCATAGGASVALAGTLLELTVTDGPHAGAEFTLAGHDCFVVGRGKCAHFKLPKKDRYFSRFHFMIEFNPPLCRLLDLGSTNGTFVNGIRTPRAELKDGDAISGGKTVLRVALHDQPAVGGEDGRQPSPNAVVETVETLPRVANPEADRPGQVHPGADSATTDVVPVSGGCVRCGAVLSTAGGSRPPRLCQNCCESVKQRPQPFEGYELVRELGRGGMGIVHLAIRRRDGALVALKTLRWSGAVTGREIARFLLEAMILREIDHPGIVRFLDVAESRGQLYYVMDYVPGWSADRVVKRAAGPLAVDRVSGWVCQALEALEYAHSRKYVHRDIKPANLLVEGQDGAGRARLADFGLARVFEASQISGLTFTEEIGGTIEFMPPEQITSFRDARPSVDIYSIGATLYYLLTGRHVYDFPKKVELKILKVLQDPVVPIRDRRVDLSDDLVAVVDRALARDPADRFPNARAMRDALRPFV